MVIVLAYAPDLFLIIGFGINNQGFMRYLFRKRGIVFALKGLVVLFIEYIVVALAVFISIFRTVLS